jgi:hypothetical protein
VAKEYELQFTEEQLEVLKDACYLVARINTGNFTDIPAHVKLCPELWRIMYNRLEILEILATGQGKGQHPDITDEKVAEEGRIAFHLYEILNRGRN